MRQDLAFYLGLFALTFFTLAIFLPSNPLTGNAVLETKSCGDLGCSELCEPNDDCGTGMICCPSSWEDDQGARVGLCDYPRNCAVIAEYSMQGDLEEYVLVRSEKPKSIQNIAFANFWLPLIIIAALALGAIHAARKQRL